MTKDKSIFIKNIYYMLSYAFQTLNQENYDDVAAESFDEMYDLLAAILAKGIGIQLKQGLYREYINRQEELPVMRGKINLPGTIKNRLVRKQLLTCDYDELSENNLLNQIIKTAVMLLLRNAKVKAEYKDDLKKKMLFFSDVDKLEPTSIRWSSIRFQRNNQTYRMLISTVNTLDIDISQVMPMENEDKEQSQMLFICYPKCSTCQKAKKWLDEHNIKYTERHIVEVNPTYDELKEWYGKSGLTLKKFFNTSGLLYKEMQLKDKLPTMSEEEQIQLLATNGMLVKRPLVVNGDTVLVGFKEAEWAEKLN